MSLTRLWFSLLGGVAAFGLTNATLTTATGRAGEISATGGVMGLGSRVNGVVAGSCSAGPCAIDGGTVTGANLFHRFSVFDTRGAISGVTLETGGVGNVIVGVTDPLGSFIDKGLRLSLPANLVWLSPGGIQLNGSGTFTNVRQLGLSTATGLTMGSGVFDVFDTTGAQAAGLEAEPLISASGLRTDPATLRRMGLSINGDLALDGGLLTVDRGLLMDAQGGHVLLGGARIEAPGGSVELRGRHVGLTASRLDVSDPTGSGGSITVTGEQVILEGSQLLASGAAGGGEVSVGGDRRGRDPAVSPATATTVDGGSVIRADATARGEGGQVVVYATQRAEVAGTLSARGGAEGGDGGFVETSAGWLQANSAPDLSAPAGRGGTWLIDPRNIDIVDPSLGGGPPPGGSGGGPGVPTSLINVSLINQSLDSGGSVVVDTTDPVASQQGNISLLATIRKASGGDSTVDFQADGTIVIDVPGANARAFSNEATGGRLDVNLWYEKLAAASQPAGSMIWRNGAIDVDTGILHVLQGAAQIDGNIELTGSGDALEFRSGRIQIGDFSWGSTATGNLVLGASNGPQPAILEVSRRYTQSPGQQVKGFGNGVLRIGPSALASIIDGGTLVDNPPRTPKIIVESGATLKINQATIDGFDLNIESGGVLFTSGINQLSNVFNSGSIFIAPQATLNLNSPFINQGLIQGSGQISVGSAQGDFTNGGPGQPAGAEPLIDPVGSLRILAGRVLLETNSLLRFDGSTSDQLSVFGDVSLGGGLVVTSAQGVPTTSPFDLIRSQQLLGEFAADQISVPDNVQLKGVVVTDDPILPARFVSALTPLQPPAPQPAPQPPPQAEQPPAPQPAPQPPPQAEQPPSQPPAPQPAPQPPPQAEQPPTQPPTRQPAPQPTQPPVGFFPSPPLLVPTDPLVVPEVGSQIFPGAGTAPAGAILADLQQAAGSESLTVNLGEADFTLAAAPASAAPAPFALTTTSMTPALVGTAIAAGDQQRTSDVQRSLGDVSAPADSPESLRLEDLQRLLRQSSRQEASRQDGEEDQRFNPAILMVSFTEKQAGSGSAEVGANSFLDLILLSREGEPVGKRVELSREIFGAQLRALYRQLARLESLQVEDPTSPSRQIHQAILAPITPVLKRQGITTLVIVADRGLQALPFAALHDGQSYFGDRFGFSITPSLKLTSLGPPRRNRGRVLAAGASRFEGLSPLPLVPSELAGIPEGAGVDRYLDRRFTPQVLLSQAADSRYERLHVATHAEFLPGGPSQARIYTGTGAVSLQEFSRLRRQRRRQPLELFVLSACRTALGDSDSELGFAGLALQAGARSAIGTLWYVDDVATSAYFLQLYRFLDAGMQKAEALRATRRAMATGRLRLEGDQVIGNDGSPLLEGLSPAQQRRVARGMAHPYYWAGVQLIGTPW